MVYTLDEIARRIRPVAEKYHLRAVYVFGSYARGEAREDSDVDLVIDDTEIAYSGNKSERCGISLFMIMAMSI